MDCFMYPQKFKRELRFCIHIYRLVFMIFVSIIYWLLAYDLLVHYLLGAATKISLLHGQILLHTFCSYKIKVHIKKYYIRLYSVCMHTNLYFISYSICVVYYLYTHYTYIYRNRMMYKIKLEQFSQTCMKPKTTFNALQG